MVTGGEGPLQLLGEQGERWHSSGEAEGQEVPERWLSFRVHALSCAVPLHKDRLGLIHCVASERTCQHVEAFFLMLLYIHMNETLKMISLCFLLFYFLIFTYV